MCAHTHAKRPPSTTWIVDEAAAKLADNAAHRAAKTRLIKWKRFTVIQWHTHTQTKTTQSKQKSRSRRRADLHSYYYHKHSHTASKKKKCYSSPSFTLQSHSFPAPPLTAGVPRNCRSKWFTKPYKKNRKQKTITQNLEL